MSIRSNQLIQIPSSVVIAGKLNKLSAILSNKEGNAGLACDPPLLLPLIYRLHP